MLTTPRTLSLASIMETSFGDPAVFVEMLHRPEAILFYLGDLGPLSTRDLLKVTLLVGGCGILAIVFGGGFIMRLFKVLP